MLENATRSAGVQPARAGRLTTSWARHQTDADVVHMHWLEYIVTVDDGSLAGVARTLVRTARLVGSLLLLRRRRVGIVWTVHNLMPHEVALPRVQRFVAQTTAVLADDLIVHSDYARARVHEAFWGARRRPVHVIPHANYVGAYPEAAEERDATRRRLGIPDGAYVYLCFGQVRGYKRLARLAQRFRGLDDENARLLVLGRVVDDEEGARLEAEAATDRRILLRLRHVPDESVAAVHRASDAAVIAYKDVFSSGALLLALSYGVPVVAPAAGTAQELFGAPAVEFFRDVDDDMLDALARVRAGAGPEQTRAAHDAADAFPWSTVGVRTAEVYRRAAGRAPTRPGWLHRGRS
ncbi:MAG: glycosyltransferase [Solirubrobacteraceae bacterium]